MFDTGAPPDVKVGHDINQNAGDGTSSIEEQQTRESSHGQGTMGAPLDKSSNEEMTCTPSKACLLVRGHTVAYLSPGGSRERGGELQWSFARRLGDHAGADVDATALVGMSTTFTRLLMERRSARWYVNGSDTIGEGQRTYDATGDLRLSHSVLLGSKVEGILDIVGGFSEGKGRVGDCALRSQRAVQVVRSGSSDGEDGREHVRTRRSRVGGL